MNIVGEKDFCSFLLQDSVWKFFAAGFCLKVLLVVIANGLSLFPATPRLVNCPTRWSLSFIFVFLCWSSSWRLGPHIEGGRLLWPLLKAGMTVLTQFFAKCIFYICPGAAKKIWQCFYGFYPLRNSFFSPPLGPAGVSLKLWNMRGNAANIAKLCVFLMRWLITIRNLAGW